MTTTYLGPPGTFSARAAEQALAAGTVDGPLVPSPSIVAALDAVERGEADAAVVPIEDAVVGGFRETIDHLVHELVEATVHAKVIVAVDLRVAVVPGTALADVRTVVSHPFALAQAAATLRGLGVVLAQGVTSTADACRIVAEQGRADLAALASPEAAAAAGLEVVADGVTDGTDDHVAFAVVRRGAPQHHDRGRVLLFAVPGRNRPGALHTLLSPFAVRHLNLTRMETRPLSRVLGEYGVLLECDAGLHDPELRDALAELLEERTTLKLLGAYPVQDSAWGTVHPRELRGRVADRPGQLDDLLGDP